MKTVQLEGYADLDALVKELYQTEEHEPIVLKRGNSEVAVIVSKAEYKAMRQLEERLLDKLDREESAETLKEPKWICWDQLQKQLKS